MSADMSGVAIRLPAIEAIERRLGRPLRVLHIGNIANNAYNNARIQRRYGVEADVISYDYYHVMSTPEWEDAEFDGDVDANAPNWWATSLRGWRRPDWFAQGPAAACINYQHARALGLNSLARLLWRYLEARSLGHVRYMATVEGRPVQGLPLRLALAIAATEALGLDKVREPAGASTSAAALPADPHGHDPQGDPQGLAPRHPGSAWRAALRPMVRAGLGLLRSLKKAASALVAGALALPYRAEAARLRAWDDADALARRDSAFAERRALLRGHCDGLDAGERARVETYAEEHPRRFFKAMQDYDIVQGYAIDGFIPYMNGVSRYVAYEHGTLRDLPFQPDFYGAITRTAFLPAPVVVVTNSDVMPSTVRMGLDPARIVCLPHPFNEEKIDSFLAASGHLAPPDGPAVFFSPTRHHWKDTNRSWTKGNDIFLQAAGRVAAEGLDLRIILVEWGKEVEASKALIAELGLADKVTWVPTRQKHELWEAYAQAHAVVDQFTLPALGGVGFETMALGRRLITAIDTAQLDAFFGEAPPCLHAATIEECAARLREVIADLPDAAGRGEAARRWIKERHSAQRIMNLQAEAYLALLDSRD